MAIARCTSCGAEVRWAKTKNGKNMPLDPEPTDEGNVIVVDAAAAEVFPTADAARAWLLTHVGEGPFKSHFSSCPNAAEHRKAA